MKTSIGLISLILLSTVIYFNSQTKDPQQTISKVTDPLILQLHKQLVAGDDLVNKTFEGTFQLKHATDKTLLFHDIKIKIDATTDYYFLKFKPGYTVPSKTMYDKNHNVKFKVIECRYATSKTPYLFVELTEITPQ